MRMSEKLSQPEDRDTSTMMNRDVSVLSGRNDNTMLDMTFSLQEHKTHSNVKVPVFKNNPTLSSETDSVTIKKAGMATIPFQAVKQSNNED
jgi:hypothetical protein